MNNGKEKNKLSGRKKDKQRIEQEKEFICQEIFCHAQTLAEEMNVRLFLNLETEEMLFVESITVTDIQFLHKQSLFEKIVAWVKKVIDSVKKMFSAGHQ